MHRRYYALLACLLAGAVLAPLLVRAQGWTLIDTGAQTYIDHIFFVDENLGFTGGYWGTVLRTRDGGDTWEKLDFWRFSTIQDIQFLNADTGFVVGHDWGNGYIFKTTDGGDTWTQQTTPSPLSSIFMTSDSTGLAAGRHGAIYRTDDGGETWVLKESGTDLWLGNVYFLDATTAVVAGGRRDSPGRRFGITTEGIILRTTDGGETWSVARGEEEGDPGWLEILGFSFVDAMTGFAVAGACCFRRGGASYLLRTTDGGQTWSPPELIPGGRGLHKILFLDASTGYLVGGGVDPGTGGLIFYTTDGGQTWTQKESGTTNWLGGIFFTDAGTGFITEGDGWILRKKATGVAVEADETPGAFHLRQNYPNPFTEHTTIAFVMDRPGQAYLQILDMLGREVATLVSGYLPAGQHKRRWEAGGLANGVYVYRLQTGSSIATRKLVLLR